MSNPRDFVDIASSDGVQFRVRISQLSEASPVFADMFSVPQPDPSLDAPTDIVKLSEDSKTIRLLILSLAESPLTPVTSHLNDHIDSLSDLANLLQATDKYDLKTIQEHAISLLDQPKFLENNEPLRVYAIASRYGAHDTALLAARRTIQYPLLHAEYISDLEIVDGWTIYRVLRYHKKCTAAALEIATDHTWIRDGYVFFDCLEGEDDDGDHDEEDEARTTTIRTHPSRKHKQGYLKNVSVHSWWTKFMDGTKVALLKSISSETIRDRERVVEALSSASRCSRCRKRVRSDFSNFLDAFVKEVEARVKQIELVIPGANSWAAY